jgi:DNA-binding beta-propeller fold protein YncE
VDAHAQALALEMAAASAQNLGRPHDIVLSPDGSRLYVADNAKHRIVVLDARTLRERGTFGAGEVAEPHDVDFDGDGRLLVADTGNSRIAIYEVDGDGGRLVGALSGRIRRPEGVASHPDGRVLATGAASGNLVIFDDGAVVAEAGGFSSPHDVALDAEGAIWVADANNDRVVRLDASLAETRVLAGAPYDFSGPRYLDFDARGRMYVADKYSNQVKVIDPSGELVLVLGTRRAGKGPGVFDRPEGVEIRGDDIWFSDTYNDRIVRYRLVEGG